MSSTSGRVNLNKGAAILGCAPITLYRLARRGGIAYHRPTHRYLFDIEELERYLRESEHPRKTAEAA